MQYKNIQQLHSSPMFGILGAPIIFFKPADTLAEGEINSPVIYFSYKDILWHFAIQLLNAGFKDFYEYKLDSDCKLNWYDFKAKIHLSP